MNVDQIAPPTADAWKPEVGETVKGTIIYAQTALGESYDKKRTEETLRIVLDTEDGEQAIYATVNTDTVNGGYPKRNARAIAAAVRAAGESELKVGGTLGMRRGEDHPTDMGPAKTFQAEYSPPKPGAPLPGSDGADGAVTGLI